jgi:hypothetical protein
VVACGLLDRKAVAILRTKEFTRHWATVPETEKEPKKTSNDGSVESKHDVLNCFNMFYMIYLIKVVVQQLEPTRKGI